MNISEILNRKYPGTQWVLNGETYDGLDWLDESPKPTEKQLEALAPQVDYEIEYENVQALRAAAYVIESDPLKYKWEETLDPADHAALLAAKTAIRDRYPYPEPPK